MGIKKWVKILPYWLVVKFVRSMNASHGTFENKPVRYHQISEGEFVVFSKEIQEIFNKRAREKKAEKINKKKEKINKILRNNYGLKDELKRDFADEEEQDRWDSE